MYRKNKNPLCFVERAFVFSYSRELDYSIVNYVRPGVFSRDKERPVMGAVQIG
jgi:hypothetical protein